jgi:hypothetical protein
LDVLIVQQPIEPDVIIWGLDWLFRHHCCYTGPMLLLLMEIYKTCSLCVVSLGHSQPRLYPWSLYLEDSITKTIFSNAVFLPWSLSNISLECSTHALLNKRTHHAYGQPHGIRTGFVLRVDLESNLDLFSKFSPLSHH